MRVAEAFHAKLPVTGLVLTKMDGDARGGAALEHPRRDRPAGRFLGTGERTDGLEPFHPDRLAQRILGMGDILSLVERVQETVDQDEAEAAGEADDGEPFHARGLPQPARPDQEDGADRPAAPA